MIKQFPLAKILQNKVFISVFLLSQVGGDSGTTAIVAVIHNSKLYVANVGDSRCVLCRAGKTVEMSKDHKPEDEIEIARITKAGSKITSDGRIDGGLNLTRALGMHSKKYCNNLCSYLLTYDIIPCDLHRSS